MYDMPNHRERRRIAKQLGLLEKRSKLPFKKYSEEISRSISAGKEIHRKKTEDMLRDVEDQYAAIEAGQYSVASEKTPNARKLAVQELYEALGDKKSYSEISADYELSQWRKRFGR